MDQSPTVGVSGCVWPSRTSRWLGTRFRSSTRFNRSDCAGRTRGSLPPCSFLDLQRKLWVLCTRRQTALKPRTANSSGKKGEQRRGTRIAATRRIRVPLLCSEEPFFSSALAYLSGPSRSASNGVRIVRRDAEQILAVPHTGPVGECGGQRVAWITRKPTSRGRRGRSWQSALPPTKVGGGQNSSTNPRSARRSHPRLFCCFLFSRVLQGSGKPNRNSPHIQRQAVPHSRNLASRATQPSAATNGDYLGNLFPLEERVS